ncbi:hypothetical protein D3C72_2126530 [compost metagenome]
MASCTIGKPSSRYSASLRRNTMRFIDCLYFCSSSISENRENKVICACTGVDRPAVWFSATVRLSATRRSMNFSARGSVVIE